MPKRLNEIDTMTHFIKLFWYNLHCYWCSSSSYDSIDAATGINYKEKSFMKLTHLSVILPKKVFFMKLTNVVNFIKLFLA